MVDPWSTFVVGGVRSVAIEENFVTLVQSSKTLAILKEFIIGKILSLF